MLKFNKLLEEKTYYAKYITLYEDNNNILWCENNFKETEDPICHCLAHRIEVIKKNNKLFLIKIPKDVLVRKGEISELGINIHGPGIENFQKNKIRFENALPEANRTYSVLSLPNGKSGWIVSWGILRIAKNKWRAHANYDVEFNQNALFVKKKGNKLLVDEACVQKHMPYIIMDMETSFVESIYIVSDDESSDEFEDKSKKFNVDSDKPRFVEVEIVPGLLLD